MQPEVAQFLQKLTKKKPQILLPEISVFQKVTQYLATFVSRFVAKNYRKLPNLVTLVRSSNSLTRLIDNKTVLSDAEGDRLREWREREAALLVRRPHLPGHEGHAEEDDPQPDLQVDQRKLCLLSKRRQKLAGKSSLGLQFWIKN